MDQNARQCNGLGMIENADGSREHRQDFACGKRHAIGTILYAIPLVIAFCFCCRYIHVGGPWEWAALSAFLGWVALGWAFEQHRMHNYWCPACGQRITEATLDQRIVGTPRRYYCATCNVEWDTGIRVPPNSD
jgi:hypothetical protein